MPEPGTIATAIGTVRAVVELAKTVKQADIRTELQDRILELQGSLLELQDEMGAIRAENRDLNERLAVGKMQLRDDGMYWNEEGDGPFCPSCADGKGLRARVVRNPSNGYWVCGVCKAAPIGSPRPDLPRSPRRGRGGNWLDRG